MMRLSVRTSTHVWIYDQDSERGGLQYEIRNTVASTCTTATCQQHEHASPAVPWHRADLIHYRTYDLFKPFADARDLSEAEQTPTWSLETELTAFQRTLTRLLRDLEEIEWPEAMCPTRASQLNAALASELTRSLLSSDARMAEAHDALARALRRATGEEAALFTADVALARALRRECGLGRRDAQHWLSPSAQHVDDGWQISESPYPFCHTQA